MSAVLENIRKMADEVAEREGCRVYDVELVGAGQGRVLRLYIERRDGQNVSIDDCANVSHGLNLRLDVEDVIPGGAYQLEVSSPGVERVLKQPWHFETAIGKAISVKTFAPLIEYNPGREDLAKMRSLQGDLKAVQEEGIVMSPPKGEEIKIPFSAMTKAQVVFEFGGNAKGAKKNRAGAQQKKQGK